MSDKKLNNLDFDKEETTFQSSEDIYQKSLANSQEENIVTGDIPDNMPITVEGADSALFEQRYPQFDQHFRAFFAGQGYRYPYYEPAYRFGFDTAFVNHYTGDDWSEQQSSLRERWENKNPNTWDTVINAVKHGWNQALEVLTTDDISK